MKAYPRTKILVLTVLIVVVISLLVYFFTKKENYSELSYKSTDTQDPVRFHTRDLAYACDNETHHYNIPNMSSGFSAQEKYEKTIRDYDISSRKWYIDQEEK